MRMKDHRAIRDRLRKVTLFSAHVARAVLTGLARRLREADVQLAAQAGAGAAAS